MEKRYRITRHTYYQKGEAQNSTHYEVQVYKKFLWWYVWRTVKEPHYEYSRSIQFETMEDAVEFIEKLKNGNIANGWKVDTVWSDPYFEKIN